MAQFGVTSAMVSIVLSIFMAGLGLGSWASGRLIREYEGRSQTLAMRLYAFAELTIGISALVVPYELMIGRSLLGHSAVSSSSGYYLISGAWVALTLIPWCACMGATIPIGMWAIRKNFSQGTRRSFSFLYLANVLGAVVGATLPPLIVEIYGFRGTLKVGAMLNALLFVAAMILSSRLSKVENETGVSPSSSASSDRATLVQSHDSKRILVLLFMTGLTSMGAEVVWIRLFTPYLRHGRLRVRHDPGRVPGFHVCGLADLSLLEPVGRKGKRRSLGNAWARYTPAVSRGQSPVRPARLSTTEPCAIDFRNRPVFQLAGICDSDAGGSLVRRRPGPRRTRVCRQRRGLHPRSDRRWLYASAVDERTLGVARLCGSLARDRRESEVVGGIPAIRIAALLALRLLRLHRRRAAAGLHRQRILRGSICQP